MKSGYLFLAILNVLLLFFSASCKKKDAVINGSLDQSPRVVKEGLQFPWEIIWGPDNRIWITERTGRISRIDPDNGNTDFSFVIDEVQAMGEGGLLGMALHPSFASNGFLYVVYNYESNTGYREKLVRYTYTNNSLADPVVILDGIPAAGLHNGSRLWITNEAAPKIFMTTGEAGDQAAAQKTNSLGGKVLRLNIDGSIPADNPFPNDPVWSYGHRNPQGLVMFNNMLYASEHGPGVEDELNIIEKGRNYGWPVVLGPCDVDEGRFCKEANVKTPIWSSGRGTIAASGLDYYSNDLIPEWKNSLLLATLKDETLWQLKLDASGQKVTNVAVYLRGSFGRLRDICISPQGKVYICTSNGSNDMIIEING
ncbi:PQQ-dependent sugar dehydrogenase [Longitalea luteola]|uniref:PQQ-dependent sugar dehydrogenase n=1 Tax=Longitalea luteola TaxID=2812563 RepID=UPI001A96B6C6|nr:PQQ-dependent sugar dehydrogenase [Longitalea luteola]